MLKSLKTQVIQPDKIYVNLPYKSKRTGAEYIVPTFLSTYHNVQILRSDDHGPLTKLVPTLKAETDPETIIITVDNDKHYSQRMVSHLAWYSEQYDKAAWGMCGWSFMPFDPPRGWHVFVCLCFMLL